MDYCLLGKCFSIRPKHSDTKMVAEFGNFMRLSKICTLLRKYHVKSIYKYFAISFLLFLLKNININ